MNPEWEPLVVGQAPRFGVAHRGARMSLVRGGSDSVLAACTGSPEQAAAFVAACSHEAGFALAPRPLGQLLGSRSSSLSGWPAFLATCSDPAALFASCVHRQRWLVCPGFSGAELLGCAAVHDAFRSSYSTGVSMPSDECRRWRLWKISKYSKIAFASSTRVFQRLRSRSSTCMRLQNDSIMALS